MYQQVLKDKTKIEETVAKLDDYKKEALQTTWEKVNECVVLPFFDASYADPLASVAASLETSSPNCCQATSRSCSRPRVWTSPRDSRSRFGWAQCGRLV